MEPILTKYVKQAGAATLDFYTKTGGYEALKKALTMTPDAVVEQVKQSGLRGRGGAGFPTGMKWQFVDKKSPKPKYICCKVAYIYIRGEFYHVQLVLEQELAKARAAGFIGKNIFGSGFDCEIYVHRGAGAYEAGEETALIESLEGKKAQPRLKPPFPAVAGLYGCPTAVNNVETLCNVPFIITEGPEAFAKLGPEKNGGPKLYCISGHVNRPGTYEASMSTTVRELIYDPKFGGGIRGGHQLKCIIPGGSSVPVLLPEQLDIPASFDGVAAAGSMLGSAGMIVMDETTCMVWAAQNLLYFYKHESCGKCTPCREGGDWLHKLLGKVESGNGEMRDLDLLLSVANNIAGKTLCAFGDAAATPVLTTIKTFRAEYEAHIREGRCTVPSSWRAASPLVAAH